MTPQEYQSYIKSKAKSKKTSKYRNVKTERDGIKFDSKKEADYYTELELKKKAGLIIDFKRQVRYQLKVNDDLICVYIADFEIKHLGGRKEVVDVKSDFTRKLAPYRIKKKLMKAIYGIEIKEV